MIRQYTIGIPGIGMKFDADDVHKKVKEYWQLARDKSIKVKKQIEPFALSVAVKVGEASVSALRFVANNAADAHDVLVKKVDELKKEVK